MELILGFSGNMIDDSMQGLLVDGGGFKGWITVDRGDLMGHLAVA